VICWSSDAAFLCPFVEDLCSYFLNISVDDDPPPPTTNVTPCLNITMNSLKRKKPATATTNGKLTNKKAKNVAPSPAKSSPPSSARSESQITPLSLEHLVDRTYFEYNNERDDVGTAD